MVSRWTYLKANKATSEIWFEGDRVQPTAHTAKVSLSGVVSDLPSVIQSSSSATQLLLTSESPAMSLGLFLSPPARTATLSVRAFCKVLLMP